MTGKLNKAERFVKRFKEENPDLNGYGCELAVRDKFGIVDYADKPAVIPPEYVKAIGDMFGAGGKI